ncbi:hypothetical protein KP509_20G069100 [Ceratopteris richardii]|uniref:Uncharacterized protein n=1 Tax=Ceratopteris richardii TaxID=49495 RepID=A0A8T2SG70_CERRI|nr:hypothetical protein KP509_20G069100 [Ceratopteris richardii]
MIVKSLHRILQQAPEQTVCAFKNLEALLLLSQVMDIQLHEYMKFTKSNENHSSTEDLPNEGLSVKIFSLRESWKLSREAVFNLFAEYILTSEEARIVSLHSTRTMQVLFNLLWDPESRKFALAHILDVMKLPPTSKDDQEAKLELCIRYLETLSHSGIDGQPKTIDFLTDLLNGIREVLETDLLYYQSLFQEAECFVHIVSLLNENLAEQHGRRLCISVVQTLRFLLSRNSVSKSAFRSLVGPGYTTLKTLLLNNHQGSPTEELLSAVLDLLVDDDFNIYEAFVIQNEDAVLLFFGILWQSCETLQLFGLITFNRLLEESTANKVACANAGLLNCLLDWFDSGISANLTTKVVALMEILGRHSVSGKDMRKIFQLLRNINQTSKLASRKILLDVIHGMLKEEGPSVFFEMNGNDSGIMLTTPWRFPGAKGITFSCWIRVEAFPPIKEGDSESYMGLFTFLTESGKGYNMMIGSEHLKLQVLGQKAETACLNATLQPKRWYHLSISHSVGRALTGGSVLKVYIDGTLVITEKLRYPKHNEMIHKSTFGASSHVPIPEATYLEIISTLPFCGQLGPIYLFDEPLPSEQIAGIFRAGSSYMYSFLSREVGCIPNNLINDPIFDPKDGLASKVIFGFNAQASLLQTLYDIKYNFDGAADKGNYEAVIMGGTQLCNRHLLKDILDCVGGVCVLFPLLTQLDQSQSPHLLSDQERMDITHDSYSSYVYVAAEVIELITSVLGRSSAHQQFIYKTKGISVIGFLLQSVSPQHFTIGVVSALVHLLTVVSENTAPRLSVKLVEDILTNIFLNLRIWIYTPYAVQRELLISLINYCESNATLTSSSLSFPKTLDLVQRFYWDKPRNRKVFGSKPILHPVTKDVIGARPSREEVGKLRILLLSIIEVALRDSISISDTKVLLAFISKSEDPICLEDVLHMLLRLLARKEFVSAFVENIQVLGGCQLFLGLLERQEEALRLLGLQIIGRLLIALPNEKKGSWLLSIASGVTRLAHENQRAERARINSLFAAVTERLIVFPFTDTLCATLFDILLGGSSLKQVLQREASTRGEIAEGQKAMIKTSQFVLPQVLGILMKFLLVCETSGIRVGVLRDILRLLEANPSSSEAIVQEPFWQQWFFDLLTQCGDKTDAYTEVDNASMLKEEESIVYAIFAIIHCFCIYRLKGGWRHLDRTVNVIHIYAERGQLNKFTLLYHIYGDLLEAVLQARSGETIQMSQPCRDNSLYVMNLLDELLINEATHESPFLKDETADRASGASPFPWLEIMLEEQAKITGSSGYLNKDEMSPTERFSIVSKGGWIIYDKLWDLLKDMHGRGRGDISGPSLGQRARGLVESINLPAVEMAAVVAGGLGAVAGGLGAVVNMNPTKFVDKAMKLRAEKFPRIAFHIVMLYIYKGALEPASATAQQFLYVLPFFLSNENEQCKNRLQLFLWCLLEARTRLALVDNGARFHLIAQLLRETLNHGKNMLVSNMTGNEDDSHDVSSVQNLLQQDRIIGAVKEETQFLKSVTQERIDEVALLKSELNEVEGLGKSNLKVLEDQLQTTVTTLRTTDSLRILSAQLSDEEDQQTVANQWCHIFRQLTDERGPWSTVKFPSDTQISWKLDKTEDPWRRKMKLKRNYHSDMQSVCPLETTERVGPSGGSLGKLSNFESLLETSKLLLKGLRGISVEEDSDITDEETINMEENDQNLGSDVHDALELNSTEELASDSEAKEQSVTKGEESFTDEVVHSSICVLVTLKRKMAGRLDVTRESIHFYGEFLVEGSAGSSVFTSSGLFNSVENTAIELVEKRLGGRDHMSLDNESSSNHDRLYSLQQIALSETTKRIKRHRRWELLKVKAVHGTRYLLQYTALELFFDSSIPPVFINFPSQKLAKEVGTTIISLRNRSLSVKGGIKEKPENKYFVDKRLALELAEHYKNAWRRREINNFEYLMQLNTLAGRSYNDLTQYPVFPWVISDYTSENLDLSSTACFRDLSKPVGALDEKRFEVFKERFENFSDPDIPSFYYGSHYSSMGIVLYYLLRLEPFTSLHKNLQGGKFDHADRLFHSIEGAFKNCLTNTSDVKELIPEFFYMPEFLVNSNKYYMGIKQDGEQLDHVILPPWAKGSPEEFIQKNREALESEYVSQHLHEWIDLIFGYKQRGRPAVEAENVFYHLTYEGAVILESLEDRLQRAAVEDQIANFGQTPIQLFRKKHPQRGPPMPISKPLYYAPASISLTSSLPASSLTQSTAEEKPKPLIFVEVVDSRVVLITNEPKILQRNWLTASIAGGSFTFSSSQVDPFFAIGAEVSQPYKLKGPYSGNLELSPSCFQTIQVQTLSYLATCGFWDNSFRLISLNDGSWQSYRRHKDVVSCIAVSSDGSIIVTGSHDTTIIVWEIDCFSSQGRKQGQKDSSSTSENLLFEKPRHVLSGHDDIITSVAVSVELDLVVSGSRDSSCILHTLREGRYVRSIQHPSKNSISRLALSKHGLLVLYSKDDLTFFLYSVNGKRLASAYSNGRINCMKLSSCGEFLICGGDQGQLVLRSVYSLEIIRRYDGTNIPIISIAVTPDDCFLAGLNDGSLLIYSIERSHQKKANILQTLRARTT